jgi:hypothetical protein
VIDLGTLSNLHGRRHELHAYCRVCDRWHVLDLGALIARGQGNRRLPIRLRCMRCGEVGVLQVRPPMPAPASAGWIPPPTGVATAAATSPSR